MHESLYELIAELVGHETNVRFTRLLAIATTVFGPPRIRGSHHIFSMPWAGDPRINLQKGKGGKAMPYQVRQVIAALRRLADEDEK